MNKTIIICCPGDCFSGKFIKCLTHLIKHLSNIGFKVFFCSAYSRNIYEVRNKCMLGSPIKGPNQQPFNGRKYDYILWIDNDMVFTATDFDLLYKEDLDVISGLYIMANDKDFAAVEYWDEDHFQKHGSFEFLAKENVHTRYMPFKVEYVGFGFILFKSGIFEQLQYPWFEPTYLQIKESKDYSMEDVTLCLKLKEKKINIYAHPNVILGHEKTVELRI